MNISGINPANNELANIKSNNQQNSLTNNQGQNFMASLDEVRRSANLEISNGNAAGSLSFYRRKEEHVEPFSFQDLEEELIDDHIARIQKMIKDLQK